MAEHRYTGPVMRLSNPPDDTEVDFGDALTEEAMTTAPKTRDELVELIFEGIGKQSAEAVLEHLENHGVQCVPVEATEEMKREVLNIHSWPVGRSFKWFGWGGRTAGAFFRAMLKSSPYANPETKG